VDISGFRHCYLIKYLLPYLFAISREGREKVLDGLLAALSCFIVRVVFPKRATSLVKGN
jgi:hypothetical protein